MILPPECAPVRPVAEAIASIEGVAPARKNPMGISPHGRPLTFPTLEHGWRVGCLAIRRRIAQGGNTPLRFACGVRGMRPWALDCQRYAHVLVGRLRIAVDAPLPINLE